LVRIVTPDGCAVAHTVIGTLDETLEADVTDVINLTVCQGQDPPPAAHVPHDAADTADAPPVRPALP